MGEGWSKNMSEKVKLPREVAEAIEHMRGADLTDYYIIGEAYRGDSHNPHVFKIMTYIRANTGDWDEEHEKGYTHILKALVNGYEVEETPEEVVARNYSNVYERINLLSGSGEAEYWKGVNEGVRSTLKTLNIKIDGVNT